jgi:Fibronectin type III domain
MSLNVQRTPTMIGRHLAVLGTALLLIAFTVTPTRAQQIETAVLVPTCNNFTISVKASQLVPGQSYTIQWSISVTDACATPGTATYSITFTAPSNGIFSATLPNSTFPFDNTFPPQPCALTFSGTATLVGFNTIPITFPNGQKSMTVNCAPPTPTPVPPPTPTATPPPSFGQAAGNPAITSTTVTLSWNKSPSRAVKGYRLRCGLTSGRNYSRIIDVGKATVYKISNLIPGKTYYCVVTAYDTAGRESPASNEISFTVSPSALKKRK